MNDEIKEILKWLQDGVDMIPDYACYGIEISDKDCRILLDYITNLQEINNNLKEDFKRHIDRINELTNRIEKAKKELKADLQEANENAVWWHSRYNAIEKENEELKSKLECYENGVYFSSKVDELQERIEKAVEYLDKHKIKLSHSFDEPDCDYWIATNPQDIIDILNGKE